MKSIAPIQEAWDTGNFLGINRSYGRVTVEKDWMINSFPQITTTTTWPTADRVGPWRYFQHDTNDLSLQTVLDNVKSINIDRSIDTDAASCTIVIYNSVLGDTGYDPGYYSYNRGSSTEAQARWGHVSNDWNNVLTPMALLRTYEGWGGYTAEGTGPQDAVGKYIYYFVPNSQSIVSGDFTLNCEGTNLNFVFDADFTISKPAWIATLETVYGAGNVNVDVYGGGIGIQFQGTLIAVNVSTPTVTDSNLVVTGDDPTLPIAFDSSYDPQPATPGNVGSYMIQMDLQDAIDSGHATITGTWIVDSVVVGTNGLLTLTCRDAAKLLIEQMLYPPVIPAAITPLKYFRWKDTTYNAIWDPGAGLQTIGTSPIAVTFANSSVDQIAGNVAFGFALTPHTNVLGHDPGEVADDSDTYALGYGWPSNNGEAADWWEIFLTAGGVDINRVLMQPWGGGYTAYVSVMVGGTWQGDQTIPYTPGATDSGAGIPYVAQTGLSFEIPLTIELPATYTAQRVRVTLKDIPVGGGFTTADTSYRSGMKEIAVGLSNLPAAQYTFAIARNFDNGYWVVAANGQVFHFGSAGDLTDNSGNGISTIVIAAEGHPSADGLWTLEQSGRVHSYGASTYYGDPSGTDMPHDFIDIAATPSGNGYWLLRSTGGVYAYGDADYYGEIPSAAIIGQTATAIAAHPTSGGYWITNFLGEVSSFGPVSDFGGVTAPRPASGTVAAIESTDTGNGYWILWGNGQVFSYGDALNQFSGGPGFVGGSNAAPFPGGVWWDLIRTNTPDTGSTQGIWAIRADGHLGLGGGAHYFGAPGGSDATVRTDGNYIDYVDIIKDLLSWAGFGLASTTFEGTFMVGVNGVLESTGIYSEEPLAEDVFDKKPVMDAIRTIKEVVGYITWVDEAGGFHFVAPNWFAPGNFYEDGTRVSFLPEVDERKHLFDYASTFNDDSLRSEIIITNQLPTASNTSTITTRIVPPGASFLRGMSRVAIWSNEIFNRASEQQVMAELIGMHIWFAQRTGTTTCVANPCLQVNDQVRIWERVSAESYIHFVRGISTTHDLDTGQYLMNLTTHWLGSDTSWVIKTSGSTAQNDYVILSPEVISFLDGTGSEAANPANFTGLT